MPSAMHETRRGAAFFSNFKLANVDGGLSGWLAVLGAWLLHFAMVGVMSAFGSYQTFYEFEWLKTYAESAIAWIGSLQLFLELL
ncbi:hypothetical protein B0H66DRAFT_609197 [Apodospora peruviana]|uniref:Uncharacterized protein n=1 Tax=Apodospora peruviana TaxID=516989 RepID=A0AAE0IQL6_9PEZI|nr:hypothetical protein B0H66DRAFT_609197 [Apodospora peruviana]